MFADELAGSASKKRPEQAEETKEETDSRSIRRRNKRILPRLSVVPMLEFRCIIYKLIVQYSHTWTYLLVL